MAKLMILSGGQELNLQKGSKMLTITDDAKRVLQEILQQNPGKFLRVTMAGFG
ncbi:hypothetical protein [Desulfuromonas thiophila]|uniref:hypothetical protein n=1 Tax=Desulfuromonas thiophila TaxID=57664 RepID=UPI0024A7A782|nr:hypothetical protein [Desulfuromonas thiophila]